MAKYRLKKKYIKYCSRFIFNFFHLFPFHSNFSKIKRMSQQTNPNIDVYTYKVPAFPAYVACVLHYTYFWMVPYWITQFIIFCTKGRLLERGVALADWIILFLWAIAAVLGNFLAERSVKQTQCAVCSPFWFFIIIDIVSIFFTVYFIALSNTILFFEFITSVITLILQCLLFVGTFISFCIVTRPIKVKPI
ncbi:hypothetical protein TRFO_08351 [Tritrichomonas foetus]|uniref:Transmembrane protein n=1 Tax=Tritrichomonas foetus TaxID=1144522 RepID=A0A1J4JJU7_9EUKA|nr:hypothetical protein TRFO_08351 [Tritrichomonas foetus]|eukprot:OHS99432.1 hypothetical protein TRFO_08351 [Tritrichomonas foetus]